MSDTSDIRVLIIDAEPSVRESLAAFLDDYGFQTAMCGSADEARDLMREKPFHVCVVDLRLPGFSGEELIDLAHRHFPEQKYIIHTSSLNYEIPEALKAIGIRSEHIFHKPVRVLTLLVKCIQELVNSDA